MVDTSSKSSLMKDYLKKYTTNNDENKKKKKIRKSKHVGEGVLIVDSDPIWQKPVKFEEEEEDSADEEKPQVEEDVDVKHMKRLELLRSRRPFGAISEDGSGWISIAENSKRLKTEGHKSDIFPPSEWKSRNDTPSPKPEQRSDNPTDAVLPIPRQQRKHLQSTCSETKKSHLPDGWRARYDSPSPEPYIADSKSNKVMDLSPPRRQQKNKFRPSHEPAADLSPPRKIKNSGIDSLDDYGRNSRPNSDSNSIDVAASASDLSPPRKRLKRSPPLTSIQRTGLVSRVDVKEEVDRKKKEDLLRFKEMDASVSGRDAEPVYRNKITGERISTEEFLRSQKDKHKKEEKPKEIKLEWGKGLAQKREAEGRLEELEIEKSKPFARSRDDPDLDRMLKERVRWGDPMAHLVTKRHSVPVLPDLGDSEKMKESGFMIPQEIPSHSWIRRGLDAAPNRYGIKPGRHWDGVDRSNGCEKELFKRMNEKRATEQEAYLWSVSEM